MREIALKVIVEMLFIIEELKKHHGITEWEVYNAKYWKLEELEKKGQVCNESISNITENKN